MKILVRINQITVFYLKKKNGQMFAIKLKLLVQINQRDVMRNLYVRNSENLLIKIAMMRTPDQINPCITPKAPINYVKNNYYRKMRKLERRLFVVNRIKSSNPPPQKKTVK